MLGAAPWWRRGLGHDWDGLVGSSGAMVTVVTQWWRSAWCAGDDDKWEDMGVSENSVPLNPMVNDHYPY